MIASKVQSWIFIHNNILAFPVVPLTTFRTRIKSLSMSFFDTRIYVYETSLKSGQQLFRPDSNDEILYQILL